MTELSTSSCMCEPTARKCTVFIQNLLLKLQVMADEIIFFLWLLRQIPSIWWGRANISQHFLIRVFRLKKKRCGWSLLRKCYIVRLKERPIFFSSNCQSLCLPEICCHFSSYLAFGRETNSLYFWIDPHCFKAICLYYLICCSTS